MKLQFQSLIIFIASLFIIGVITLITISLNRAYYPGFEKGLDYFSPDLSESITILRDRITIDKKSKVKLIFEVKDPIVFYEYYQFQEFINNLTIEIWNGNEFLDFNPSRIDLLKTGKLIFYDIGELKGSGEYNIYIHSINGMNHSYHIGIGIGRESINKPLSNNEKSFF